MKQYVFAPLDNSWRVSYLTNGVNINDRLFINEIKSFKAGKSTPGLLSEGQAINLWDEYAELTYKQILKKAQDLNLSLKCYEDGKTTTELNLMAADFLTFSIPTAVSSTIDKIAKTITVVLPIGTTVTSLAATFTANPGTTVKIASTTQTSGSTTNNLTSPVTYKVYAADGVTHIDYVVTAVVLKDAKITAFDIATSTSNVIDETAKTIAITVPFGTSPAALVATFTATATAVIKVGATTQASGTTANNFTNPVLYVVTSGDELKTQTYTVTVTIASA